MEEAKITDPVNPRVREDVEHREVDRFERVWISIQLMPVVRERMSRSDPLMPEESGFKSIQLMPASERTSRSEVNACF